MSRATRWTPAALALIGALFALLVAPVVAHAAAGSLGAPGTAPFDSAAAEELMGVAERAPDLPSGFTETTVWSGLAAPTAFRFAPDGRVFVALKSGMIVTYDGVNDSTPSVYADLRTQVADFWDRGLLGLAVDPQFDRGRPYIYALYTYNKDPNSATEPRWPNDSCPTPPGANADGCVVTGRLSRLSPDGTEKVLIEDWCQQYPTHSVGTIQFGPDGALYVGSGDGASYTFADYGQDGAPINPCGDPPGTAGSVLTPPTAQGGALRSQSYRREAGRPVSLDGAILRVDPDTGQAMSDNPNANDPNANRRRIVAYGFRNPYRFTFRPGTNEIWAGDVGWDTWEEIDRIEDPLAGPTENYGWPCYEGDAVMGAYRALGVNACESLYQQGPNAVEDPYFVYQHGSSMVDGDGCGMYSSSITGISFYSGGNFPAAYQNGLFFTDYARGCIWWMPAGEDGLPDASDVRLFQRGTAGAVYLQQGPDGALWYSDIEGGTIRRIAYPGGNGTPSALATAEPASGPVPLHVQFDGSESSDSNGDEISYAWDLDGDGTFDDSTGVAPTFTYTEPGRHIAKLRVTDNGGLTDTMSVMITAGELPRPVITSPTTTYTWATNDEIAFSGEAVDAAGNAIPASGLSWQLNIRHCSRFQEGSCHTHTAQNTAGVATGTFTAPDHDWPSYLELVLTATDSHGLTATKTVNIHPRTVDLTFTSTPSGAELNYGSYTLTTPATMTVIEGSQSTLTAGTPQAIDGHDVDFASWNDGSDRTRSISPTQDTEYHANFVASTSTTLGGHTTVGSNRSSVGPGGAEAYRFRAETTGNGSKLRAFIDQTSTANALTIGLYSDTFGEPGSLLGAGTSEHVTPGEWNEVPLPASVEIEEGQYYWLSLLNPLTSGGQLAWRDRATPAGGGPERTSLTRDLTMLPPLWSTLGRWSDGPLSAYVLGSTDGPVPSVLDVTPASLTFGATEGAASPSAKTLSVSNAGEGTLEFSASSNRTWLSATPATGTAPRDIAVTVDTTGLAAGTHTGSVTVDAGRASRSPKSIPVTVTVAPQAHPVLATSPTSLSFNAVAGGANPSAKTVNVTNTGDGDLNFTASDSASWLTVTPTSGSAPRTVSVAVNVAGLSAGTYNATITIDAGAISGSPGTIPVTLIVSTAPAPGTDTLGGATVVGSNASSQPPGAGEAYRISGASDGVASRLRLYIDSANTANQLVLGLYSDFGGSPATLLGTGSVTTVVKGAWNEVTLATPVALTAGTPYWFALLNPVGSGGSLVWRDRAGGVGGPEQTTLSRTLSALPLSWSALGIWSDGPVSGYVMGTAGAVVPPPAKLAVSDSAFDFAATEGGSAPATRSFLVSNDGGGDLDFTVSDDAAWLSATPASGSAPRAVTVAVDPSGLAAGTYIGNITVGAGSAGSKTVKITLTVAPRPAVLTLATNALAFSAQQGGAAPAVQTVAVTNTGGGALSYTASTNRAWLRVTPASGAAPGDLTITIDPAGLGVATRTGDVTVDAGSAGTRTVTVTLTINAPPAALEVSGSTLSFSAVEGGTTPTARSLSVRNTGGGSLSFMATTDEDWLFVTPETGAAPADLSVGVNLAGLLAGTYHGVVTVEAGPAGQKQVAVTLTVAERDPVLALSESALAFSGVENGADPAARSISLSNVGGGTLSFSASSDQDWLTVSPHSGTAPGTLSVSVDLEGLAAGDHTGRVTVDAGAAGTKSVAVTLTVVGAPELALSHSTLAFSGIEGAANPAARTVSVSNAGPGTLNFTATSDTAWLHVTPASGTAPRDLSVSVDLGGLQPGEHSAHVTVTSGASTKTIVVTLQVAPRPAVLALSTEALSFAGTQGGASPSAKSVSVSNSGGGSLSFTAQSDAAWLSVSPGSGAAPRDVSVSVNLSGLAPGDRTGHITVDAGAAGTKTVTVTLSVAERPAVLALSTEALSFAGTQGGASPSAKSVSVSNSGGGSLSFTAQSDAAWLSVSPGSGAAPRDVSVSVNLSGLAPGDRTGHITVDAGAAGTKTITVTLAVAAPPALSASPSALAFNGTSGGAAPAAQAIAVSHTGGGTLPFTVAGNQAWLSATPSSGSSPGSVSVSVSLTGLTVGTHTGSVTITAPGATGSPVTIPVTLTVTQAASAGLVGAWGFDEGAGTTATDSSGKGNNGTISGATRTAGRLGGGGLSFNGRNNWVTVANNASLNLGAQMTLEGWAYLTEAGWSWRTLMVKETSDGLAWALYPIGDRGLPGGHVSTPGELWATGTAAPTLNRWTHFAVTYDGTQIRTYVDGVLVGARAQTGAIVSSTQPLRFGGNALWAEWLNGQLDELRVYNRALSAAEIQTDMTTPVRSAALSAASRGARTVTTKRAKKAKPSGKAVKIKRYRARRPHAAGKRQRTSTPAPKRVARG
ncbi:choice-of-anchor D domain-containing protein [Solirubrobacter taibaiensis]|nr:choice-of-anchor D domain-containing protein [Solirubrobacter taibaiensis]